MEELNVKKVPSTGMIVGIIIAVIVIVIIIAILFWLFSPRRGTVILPSNAVQQPAIVQPVIVQPQPQVVQPIVGQSRRVAPSNVGTRRREGATFKQVLGIQK